MAICVHVMLVMPRTSLINFVVSVVVFRNLMYCSMTEIKHLILQLLFGWEMPDLSPTSH